MIQIILILVLVAFLLLIFRLVKNRSGDALHSSRGAYMRELNKKMEDSEKN